MIDRKRGEIGLNGVKIFDDGMLYQVQREILAENEI